MTKLTEKKTTKPTVKKTTKTTVKKMTKPVCPNCKSTDFEAVAIGDYHMSFICCTGCGAIVAYRDNLLIDKLDRVAEAVEFSSH